MGVLSNYSQYRDLIELVREKVGHLIDFDTGDGDALGMDGVEKVWRVIPAGETTAHEFLYWYKACNQQWFPSAEEAASAYCQKWQEWHQTSTEKHDYGVDTIEYRP